ncbi:hypothetical protein [Endozoicomonas sp. GU-1]|uniref:hypothetical protein n=1 Tax=Endozoicomonas sp. GU-1 TaxID=3009078 RepID=UPI0022B5DD6B|nr:hypothetical protein [Endozoicomonas sp. GU-1]WBA83180.1 hypothetical protein O2T12_08715 [Endozoicomonas sp. GU-1]WBA86105.1 hypothetical protein O3276_23345 [Endozoicomonas sp. GU-1]
MQPFSSTYVPLSGAPGNSHLNEPANTNPTGTLGKFAVAVQSGVSTFFRSLSPNYVPEHQRHISQPTAPVASTVPADHKNDKTSLADNVVQGVGLASKALSCWVPNASAVGDAIGTICSSIFLVNRLDDMAVSGKSGKSGKESTIGSENVSKDPSQKVTDKKQENEKPGKPVTALGTTNRVSGPAMATVTLMAMDRLAGAAAQNTTVGHSSGPTSETANISTTTSDASTSNATTVLPGTTMTGNNTSMPLPSINATNATATPSAGTFSHWDSPWSVLGFSLSTAVIIVTIAGGVGLYALSQYYHRRDEARQQADPEIPLKPLNQQANN